MKNFSNYEAKKYAKGRDYSRIEYGIYQFENAPQITYTKLQRWLRLNGSRGFKYNYGSMLTNTLQPKLYVTSLSFEQEPAYDEGDKPSNISQYPFEDLLDKYSVHVSDFYTELNNSSKTLCYQEFASPILENVKKLRKIIGKHAYYKDGRFVVE